MKTMSGPILVDFTMSFPPAQTFPSQQPPELISLAPWLTNLTNKISSYSPVKLIISCAALCQILYWPLNPSFCSSREFFIFFNAEFELLSQKTPFVEPRLCLFHLPFVHFTAWSDENQRHFFLSPWSNFVLKLNCYWEHQRYQYPKVSSVPSVSRAFRLVPKLKVVSWLQWMIPSFPAWVYMQQRTLADNMKSWVWRIPAAGYLWCLLEFRHHWEPCFLLHTALGNKWCCTVQEELCLSSRFAVNGKGSSCIPQIPAPTSLSWG